MLYAGSLDKAREIFTAAIKHRPRIRLTIRQRARVLDRCCYVHRSIESLPISAKIRKSIRTASSRHGVMSDWSDEQTDDPLYADLRNFYKVEAWSRDGMRIDALLYAGSNLDKAREIFVATVKQQPRIKLTIRQRTRVLQHWPPQ
jgi:hypothetical protein